MFYEREIGFGFCMGLKKKIFTFTTMTIIKNLYPKVTRPGEYVAFFHLELPTMEGPVFAYLACDAYSQYCFNLGAAKDESPETILKHIYLLTEDETFLQHRDKGFTLVLSDFEELSVRIECIIKSVKGTLLYNSKFHSLITKQLRQSLREI